MTTVGNYDRWLRAMADRLVGQSPEFDDLVNEGRIAIWRAEAAHDPARGALPSWVTRAAEMRMKDVAWGSGRPFGHEATRGRRDVDVALHLEELNSVLRESLEPSVSDFAEIAALAYHHGELYRTIERLSPRQQQAVRVILAGGIMNQQERAAWVDARHKLRIWLEHLDEAQ